MNFNPLPRDHTVYAGAEWSSQNTFVIIPFPAYLGFTCPPDARQFGLGQEEYRYFRSPSDCQRYFICIENRPRLYNCGEGRAFNDLINACDGIENVTGCAVPGQFQTQPQNQFRGAPTKLPTSRFSG